MSVRSPVKGSDNVFIGEDKILEFTIDDGAGVVEDITGWSIEWVLRDYPEAPTVILTKTTAAGSILLWSPSHGVCRVILPRTDTVTLKEQTYSYTLRRTDSGQSSVLAFGDFVVKEPSTR